MILAFFAGGMPGMSEMLIVAVVLIVLFGAKKLPELARSLGASLGAFKKGRKEGLAELEAPESAQKDVKSQDKNQDEGSAK